MKFARDKFFAAYRNEFGSLKQLQVDGLNSLLDFMEHDPKLVSIRHAAYMLETTGHETARTFQPIKERGSRAYFIKRYGGQTALGKRLGNDTPEEGAIYAGRGDVQITGEANYEKLELELRREYPGVVAEFEARTGRTFDLTVGDQNDDDVDPDNALDPKIAYMILSVGMRKGLFTGKKLSDYIDENDTGKVDYFQARKIVNPGEIKTNPAVVSKMAANSEKWESILKEASQNQTEEMNGPVVVEPLKEAPKESFIQVSLNGAKRMKTWLTGLGISLTTAATGIIQFAGSHPVLTLICIIVVIVAVVVATMYYQHLLHTSDSERRRLAADPTKHNVL